METQGPHGNARPTEPCRGNNDRQIDYCEHWRVHERAGVNNTQLELRPMTGDESEPENTKDNDPKPSFEEWVQQESMSEARRNREGKPTLLNYQRHTPLLSKESWSSVSWIALLSAITGFFEFAMVRTFDRNPASSTLGDEYPPRRTMGFGEPLFASNNLAIISHSCNHNRAKTKIVIGKRRGINWHYFKHSIFNLPWGHDRVSLSWPELGIK